jgi:dihydrodipicolinate synthase/N-acetylneuraminate lyase
MKEISVTGVIPPVITPFKENGTPDLDTFGRLLDFLIENVHGLYPLGTYGSGPLMPKEMRMDLAEFIVKTVDGRVPVIMHIGAADTDTAVELAKAAEKSGADAIASIVPFYYKYDERCLTEHFTRVLESVDIPFYVYNNPGMGNNTITPRMLATLADKGLRGIKDSSFDILTFYAFMRTVQKKNFDFIIGTEALLVSAVVAGATGCVSGVSNTFPELMARLWNAAKAGEMDTAMALQQKVNRIREIMHLSNSITAMHAMLKLRGMDIGFPRRPLLPAEDGLVAQIRKGLEELELI